MRREEMNDILHELGMARPGTPPPGYMESYTIPFHLSWHCYISLHPL
jgi:hypothetical protein